MNNAIKVLLQMQNGFLQLESTLEAYIYVHPFAKTNMFIMSRLNINKCHSCQMAGNSNFTLFYRYFHI
jgi:hypothetical protein